MSYLVIAQCMAGAAFIAVAMIHLLVWSRVRSEINHLLFALTAAAAAANAFAEISMYRAGSLEAMAAALRWYVASSGCWAIAMVWFLAAYAQVGRLGRCTAAVISSVVTLALLTNAFSPASFLYTKLTGLRVVDLPWREQFFLAIGEDNPWRIATELAWMAVLIVVADGCYRFWVRGQRQRAVLFGVAVFGFMACFGTHAFFVDTGKLNSPYLSTYGFLALAGLMSYELAGEVLRKAQLSSQLMRKEDELQTAVANERSRIAGDLHDSVTQTLFSTAAIADALPEVWERHPDQARRGLDDLKLLTKGALAEMRTLLLELRPAALLERTLGELLQQLASATAGRTRIPVDVEIDGDRRFPEDVQVAFYRVAQEAINNVVKHAEATQVRLQLKCGERDVVMNVQDDGRGLEENGAMSTGMGLNIMRERMEAIGGRLRIDSTPELGTTVEAQWTGSTSRKASNGG